MNKPSQDIQGVNFNSPRLESRLAQTLDAMTQHPGESILGAAGSRSQAKATYNMLGNDNFSVDEVKRNYAIETSKRMDVYKTVLLVQDTTTNNLNNHKKTDGLGWCDEFNKGALIHTCMAITVDGVPLGVLSQQISTRPQRKDESATKSQKRLRPIEEKESYRWLETMTEANTYVPSNVNAIHICDREGDFYEFYAQALAINSKFIVRVIQNRIVQEHKKAFDYIKTVPSCGTVTVKIPRDTRNGKKARSAELEVRYAPITFCKPQIRKEDHLPLEITAMMIHIVEAKSPDGAEPIEWFLLTTETVKNFDDAVSIVGYYVQRWKIERFHYVLKSGCQVEKIQERTFERQSILISLYTMVAIYIMALTYLAREAPETPCNSMFDEDEWKILYCAANKTKQAPEKPYTLKEAVKYLSKIGSFSGAPSDGDPGAKVIWRGLDRLFTLVEYKGFF
jgi:hypothetical protein